MLLKHDVFITLVPHKIIIFNVLRAERMNYSQHGIFNFSPSLFISLVPEKFKQSGADMMEATGLSLIDSKRRKGGGYNKQSLSRRVFKSIRCQGKSIFHSSRKHQTIVESGLDQRFSASQPNIRIDSDAVTTISVESCGIVEHRVGSAPSSLLHQPLGNVMPGSSLQPNEDLTPDSPSSLWRRSQARHNTVIRRVETIHSSPLPRHVMAPAFENSDLSGDGQEMELAPRLGPRQVQIRLREGRSLVVRDRGGTSDPYVKFKLGGKIVYKSRIIYKNLNPVWNECFTITVEQLPENMMVKVFDHDIGMPDDFMGSSILEMVNFEPDWTEVCLKLEDVRSFEKDMGEIVLDVRLAPAAHVVKDTATITEYLPVKQSFKLSDIQRKSQLWSGIASVTLIEGRDIQLSGESLLGDPFVKFRLCGQKYKSKTVPRSSNPQWREQFELHLYKDRGTTLDIEVWLKVSGFNRRDECIGRCQVDLLEIERERTHKMELTLTENTGSLLLLLTLTASCSVSITELTACPLEDPNERAAIVNRYALTRSFQCMDDVGFLQVKVIRAEGLMAADVTGKSDPFCVVELDNDRLLTHTVYKTLNPQWNKVFTFNIRDFHSVLEVTVYDEDRDRSVDFLGKIAIPVLSIKNGEHKALALKNKHLTGCTKGIVHLEMDVIFNPIKASLRTFRPKEIKYLEAEPKLSKQLMLKNFSRARGCVMAVVGAIQYVNSCFRWECPQRSFAAFLIFLVAVWNFDLYMVPLVLLLLLGKNYLLLTTTKDGGFPVEVDCVMMEDEEEDDEKDDKDSERKGLIDKLHAMQEVCISVQNMLGQLASLGERVKNTFNWTTPFLSWLAVAVLATVTLILYMIPLRYIILIWGINKFTKKLRNPDQINNNEVLDFLSRVPSDVQRVQYRELKPEATSSPAKKKKNTTV
uniref:Multiple C2 domains, transmembrane 1a n=1 Tax=Eptatretus burgeri TaxID=7764 RepID=A0A8C4QG06_EPTBU